MKFRTFTVSLCAIAFLAGLAFVSNDANAISVNPILYSQYDRHFDPIRALKDTNTIGKVEVTLYSQVSKGIFDDKIVYGYAYQLLFSQDPGLASAETRTELNLGLAINFNDHFVKTPLGYALWGQSVKGDLWPYPSVDANQPLAANFFAENNILYWDLPDAIAPLPNGNIFLTTPMIVFSYLAPEKTKATLLNGKDRVGEGFVSIGSRAPAPVPEPATMLLVGVGLAGLVGVGRKKTFKK